MFSFLGKIMFLFISFILLPREAKGPSNDFESRLALQMIKERKAFLLCKEDALFLDNLVKVKSNQTTPNVPSPA